MMKLSEMIEPIFRVEAPREQLVMVDQEGLGISVGALDRR
jgi:hypothetical protein